MLYFLVDILLDFGDIVFCVLFIYFVFMGILEGVGVKFVGVVIDD